MSDDQQRLEELHALDVRLAELAGQSSSPEEQKRLSEARELTRKLLAKPSDVASLMLLNLLLVRVGLPALSWGAELFPGGVQPLWRLDHAAEKYQTKFDRPVNQCPRCGKSFANCRCT